MLDFITTGTDISTFPALTGSFILSWIFSETILSKALKNSMSSGQSTFFGPWGIANDSEKGSCSASLVKGSP